MKRLDSNTYAIGIDLGGTNIKAGLCSYGGKIIKSLSYPTPVRSGANSILDALINAGSELLKHASKQKLKVTAVGVGSPGVIDVDKGIVVGNTPNLPDWRGIKLREKISKGLGLPCAIDNDANLFLLAESIYGAAKRYRNVFGLTLGTGIGGAILIDKQIYHGCCFVAGEIGHMPIVANGRKCKCGLRGCLEVYASAPALVKQYKKLSSNKSRDLDAAGIFNKAKNNDVFAITAVEKWCDYLSWGIASVVNILNPEVVVLGGGVAEAGDYLQWQVAKALRGKILLEAESDLEIKIAKLGNKAGLLGAAANAIICCR